MRQVHPMDTNDSFQKSAKDIIQAIIIIKKETLSSSENKHLRCMTSFDFSIFHHLVGHEIFDHPQLLKEFTKEVIDEYATLKMPLDQIEKACCDGNFNTNPLLKMMIINFAYDDLAKSQIGERGWIKCKDIAYRVFAISLYNIYSKGKEQCEHKVGFVEYSCPHFLSQSTIKFFHDNKLGFKMDSSFCLVRFLKRLEYIGGLPKETISSINEIIKFRDHKDGIFKWNKDTFIEYLTKEKRICNPSIGLGISPEEYDMFVKLIE